MASEREREREEQTTRRFHLEIISLFQVEPTEKRLSRGPPLKRGVPPLKGEPREHVFHERNCRYIGA